MKKLIVLLFVLLSIPLSCSAISLSELQSNSERYKNIAETPNGGLYIDTNSIKSLRYTPPYYTMQAKSYITLYNISVILEDTVTYNYDYTRSFDYLIKKVNKENPSMPNQEKEKLLLHEVTINCGINSSFIDRSSYKFTGEFITAIENEYDKKINYRSGSFAAANYIFKKVYNQDFIPE